MRIRGTKKGAKSGRKPDMADTRENQSNQDIMISLPGDMVGDIMYPPAYPPLIGGERLKDTQ